MNRTHLFYKRTAFQWLFVILLLLAVRETYSQIPLVATIQSPANLSNNVALQPTITITTSYPINADSISYIGPDVDSAVYNVRPTVLVVPRIVADNLPAQQWHYYAVHGTYTLVNATTLHFKPSQLSAGTEYSVVVNKLYASASGPYPVPVLFPPVTSKFTTVGLPHKVVATSLDGYNTIDCQDEIIVYFNREISNPLTPLGPLVEVEKVISVSTNGSIQTAPTGVLPTLKSDNRLVSIKPNGIPGQHYLVRIHTSYLTGNSSDDKQLHVFVRNGYRLKLTTDIINSAQNVPGFVNTVLGTGDVYFDAGETVTLHTLAEYQNVRFVRWDCPKLPQLHNATTPTVSFSQDCRRMTNATVTAVYEIIQSTTIQIQGTTGAWVQVFDREYNYLGTTGTYSVLDSPNDSLIVHTGPYGGHTFGQWDVNPVALETLVDKYSAVITLKHSQMQQLISLKPGVVTNPTTDKYKLTGAVYIEDEVGIDPSTIYMFTTPSFYEEDEPGTASVGIAVINGCFEIVKSIGSDGVVYYNPPVEYATRSGQLTKNGNVVSFFIRRKKTHFRIEQVMLKNRETEEEDLDTKVTHKAATVVFKLVKGQWEEQDAAVQYDQDGRTYREYEFSCGDQIKVVNNGEEDKGVHFSHWSDNLNGYISPGNRASNEYVFTVSDALAHFTASDGHKQIRARVAFFSVFKLVEVGLHVLQKNGSFALKYFPANYVYVFDENEPIDGRQVKFFPGEGTRVHLRFNQPYNRNTVDFAVLSTKVNPGIQYSHLLYHSTDAENNLSHLIQSGYQEANEMVYSTGYMNNGNWAPKMSYYLHYLRNTLKSKTGVALENPMTIAVEIELPSVQVTYKKLTCRHSDEDPNFWPAVDRGDMFTLYQSAVLEPKEDGVAQITSMLSNQGRVPSCGNCRSYLEVDESADYTSTILQTGRMKHHGYIQFYTESWDVDGLRILNELGKILADVGEYIEGAEMPKLEPQKDAEGNVEPPSWWEEALKLNGAKLVGGIMKKIGESLENGNGNPDDFIGTRTMFLGKMDMWGQDSTGNKEITQRDTNAEWLFKVTLY